MEEDVLLHASKNKVIHALQKRFHWSTLRKDAADACRTCSSCAILNARRARAHRHYRAKVHSMTRSTWALDFYGVYPSKSGFCELLGAVDMATHELRLFPLKTRNAATLLDALLHGIILRDGVPLAIHSDHAREFVGKAMKALTRNFGIKQSSTLGHHPTGNALMERTWQYVTKCLRLMTDGQYRHWEDY